jgi:hypothetical protein
MCLRCHALRNRARGGPRSPRSPCEHKSSARRACCGFVIACCTCKRAQFAAERTWSGSTEPDSTAPSKTLVSNSLDILLRQRVQLVKDILRGNLKCASSISTIGTNRASMLRRLTSFASHPAASRRRTPQIRGGSTASQRADRGRGPLLLQRSRGAARRAQS